MTETRKPRPTGRIELFVAILFVLQAALTAANGVFHPAWRIGMPIALVVAAAWSIWDVKRRQRRYDVENSGKDQEPAS